MEEINNENFKHLTYKHENIYLDAESDNRILSSKVSIIQKKEKNISNDNYFTNIYQKNNPMSTNIIKKEENNIYPSKEEIMVYIKILNNFRKSADSIGQLSNGFFYTYGGENYIIIYDNNYKNILKIENLDDYIYNVTEKTCRTKNQIEIIACCNKYINLIDIDIVNYQYNIKQYQIPNLFSFYLCEMKENDYIISGEPLVMYFKNLFDIKSDSNSYKFCNKTFNSGIKINDKIVALTSNSLIQNGEDNLIICNVEIEKIQNSFPGYSFIYGKNGLCLININDRKVLLASCKKYFSEQKGNGILLIEYLDNNKKIKEIFYNTDDFEVNCICQIKDFNNKNHKKNIFFLAGGFDSEKGEGKIKLFEIFHENEENGNSLEYLQDIEFEYSDEFQGFEMTVTCINQSKNLGNILITCLDGNVYLFSKPNLSFYFEKTNIS